MATIRPVVPPAPLPPATEFTFSPTAVASAVAHKPTVRRGVPQRLGGRPLWIAAGAGSLLLLSLGLGYFFWTGKPPIAAVAGGASVHSEQRSLKLYRFREYEAGLKKENQFGPIPLFKSMKGQYDQIVRFRDGTPILEVNDVALQLRDKSADKMINQVFADMSNASWEEKAELRIVLNQKNPATIGILGEMELLAKHNPTTAALQKERPNEFRHGWAEITARLSDGSYHLTLHDVSAEKIQVILDSQSLDPKRREQLRAQFELLKNYQPEENRGQRIPYEGTYALRLGQAP